MSVSVTPSMPWDLERFFYGNPYLTAAERSTAVLILKSWDRKFWPVPTRLASQTLIGHWAGYWRSTVCRALRKLVALGYFRTTWVTVKRLTKQGFKGVTRVSVMPGPELLKLINPENNVSAAQARGVTWPHTPRTPQAPTGTVSGSVIAKRADRSGGTAVDNSEFKRKALENWPRLAGSRPVSADRLPSAVRFEDLELRTDGADVISYVDLDPAEAAAALQAARARANRLAELQVQQQLRQQPRRRPPRSQR